MLGWSAGAAAAALVAAVIGFTALGPDASQPVPPALPSTTAPTTPVDREAVSPFLAEASSLPIASEWKFALEHSSDFELSIVQNREIDPCLTSAPGPAQQESLLSQQGNIQGGQTRWTRRVGVGPAAGRGDGDSLAGLPARRVRRHGRADRLVAAALLLHRR